MRFAHVDITPQKSGSYCAPPVGACWLHGSFARD